MENKYQNNNEYKDEKSRITAMGDLSELSENNQFSINTLLKFSTPLACPK
jgi:hypothetical protein